MNDEIYKGLPIHWVNTPMSYAKLTTKYNLFQQSVLLKVSEYLQRQIEVYYGTDLSQCKDIPRPLFSDAQKQKGIGKMYVSYAELGVSANSFPKVREEARKCLESMVVPGPIIMKNGKPTQSLYPVFVEIHVDQDSATCSFELNTKVIDEARKWSVIDYTFDMSKQYVKHPDDIAILSSVEKAPGLYFLLRHSMRSWRWKKAKLTVKEIKEFLNMVEKDENGVVTKEMYPKFSQFKKHCLDPALADIRRLKEKGQLDVCFDMELMYKSSRAIGNPSLILFSIADDKKKDKPAEPTLFTEAEEEVRPEPKKPQIIPGDKAEEWGRAVSLYRGALSQMVRELQCVGTIDGVFAVRVTPEQQSLIEKHYDTEWKEFLRLCKQVLGMKGHRPPIKAV